MSQQNAVYRESLMENGELHRYLRDKGADGMAINTCVNIMKRWGFTRTEMAVVLGVSSTSLSRYLDSPCKVRLNRDRRDRASYILNIHAGLNTLFSNPNNIFGFVNMPNHNEFLGGRAPKELLTEGSMENLIDIARYVQRLSEGSIL